MVIALRTGFRPWVFGAWPVSMSILGRSGAAVDVWSAKSTCVEPGCQFGPQDAGLEVTAAPSLRFHVQFVLEEHVRSSASCVHLSFFSAHDNVCTPPRTKVVKQHANINSGAVLFEPALKRPPQDSPSPNQNAERALNVNPLRAGLPEVE